MHCLNVYETCLGSIDTLLLTLHGLQYRRCKAKQGLAHIHTGRLSPYSNMSCRVATAITLARTICACCLHMQTRNFVVTAMTDNHIRFCTRRDAEIFSYVVVSCLTPVMLLHGRALACSGCGTRVRWLTEVSCRELMTCLAAHAGWPADAPGQHGQLGESVEGSRPVPISWQGHRP